MVELFLLLVIFQVKHFICDYPLQTPYMLGKMKASNWLLPLLAHASVHAAGTFLIAVFFGFWVAIGLALLDLVLHFIVDRIKASPTLGGRYKPEQPQFWWMLGADQMAHHIINYMFILTLLNM